MRGQGTVGCSALGGILALVLVTAPQLRPLRDKQGTASSNWPTYLATVERSSFNGQERAITPQTAPHLRLHWTVRSGGSIVVQPITANGLIYWGSWDGYEHATAQTGKLVWARYLGQSRQEPCLYPTAGIASTAAAVTISLRGTRRRVLYVGGGRADFYALDAMTGAVLWKTRLGAPHSHFIWSSPAVYRGGAYVGVASYGDCPVVQGRLVRLDAATGRVDHAFDVVPAGCTGGAVWGSPTIDPTDDVVYFATGNPGSCKTAQPYTESIVAVRASNLAYLSSWQIPRRDRVVDSDFGSTPTVFVATIRGTVRQLVGVANKSGIYYAFDGANLRAGPLWQIKIARGGPNPEGGQGSVSPSAWDGNRLYVAGGKTVIRGARCAGSVRALYPPTGASDWQYCARRGPVIGAVAAVPGLVVVGAGRSLVVLSSGAGRVLFSFGARNDGKFYGAASITNGVVYIGDTAWNLYALGR